MATDEATPTGQSGSTSGGMGYCLARLRKEPGGYTVECWEHGQIAHGVIVKETARCIAQDHLDADPRRDALPPTGPDEPLNVAPYQPIDRTDTLVRCNRCGAVIEGDTFGQTLHNVWHGRADLDPHQRYALTEEARRG